jgi:molybdate transport system ATP-binding protein
MSAHPDLFKGPTGIPVHIRLENVTLRVGGRFLLEGTNWEIRPGENWIVAGPNGAGKTSLVGALDGTVPVVRGRVVRNWDPTVENPVGYVWFAQQRRFVIREDARREARYFSGHVDEQTTVEEVLAEAAPSVGPDAASHIREAMEMTGIEQLGNAGIARLSNGEMRKLLIARALLKRPRLLVLDEPFDGLDDLSRLDLKAKIECMIANGVQFVLVTHRFEDVPAGFSKYLEIRAGTATERTWKGPEATHEQGDEIRTKPQIKSFSNLPHAGGSNANDAIIEFRKVTVTYGGLVVLGQLDWIFGAGENWALTGPNGAGKSTLIRLITGEIEQAYSNEIYVFGKKRGTGESIWDIKRRIGVLGTELQLLYRKGISAFDVVVSGFYDSIGLYRRPDSEKRHNAEKIMERMKLTHLAGRIFDSLSFGEQRLVLMARAVVKSPRLLILDEPCQGLDARNRSRVIELADSIGASGDIQLLFVTHYRNEIPASVNRELRIRKPVGGITPSTFFCR